jgi:hypothetical protein
MCTMNIRGAALVNRSIAAGTSCIQSLSWRAALHILFAKGVCARDQAREAALRVTHEDTRAVEVEMATLAMVASVADTEAINTAPILATAKV